LLAFLKHHPSEVCHDVGHHHDLFIRRRQQDQISEDFRYLGSDFRQVSLLALQLALQHLVNFTMQTVGHAGSFGSTRSIAPSVGVGNGVATLSVLRIDEDAADGPDDPGVGVRLRPGRIGLEFRRLRPRAGCMSAAATTPITAMQRPIPVMSVSHFRECDTAQAGGMFP
jgi:hypothetical protein